MKILIILAILVAAYLVYRAFAIEPEEAPLAREPEIVEEPEVEVIEETIPHNQFKKLILIVVAIVVAISAAIATALVL
jgi:hypothetical protein